MATASRAETNMVDMGSLIGSIRRFGLSGPPYEILGTARPSATGEPQLRIRLLDSGEEADYPIAAILDDPLDE